MAATSPWSRCQHGRVHLLAYTASPADLELTRSLETDPEVMRELGGPIPDEEIAAIHERRARTAGPGEWWLKILPERDGPVAGTIGIWQREWGGSADHEVGWMLLPEFQGRGLASEALGMLLERARAEPAIGRVHAFPGVSNPASNALCRKFGFELLGELDLGYAGRPMRCKHWRIEL